MQLIEIFYLGRYLVVSDEGIRGWGLAVPTGGGGFTDFEVVFTFPELHEVLKFLAYWWEIRRK